MPALPALNVFCTFVVEDLMSAIHVVSHSPEKQSQKHWKWGCERSGHHY